MRKPHKWGEKYHQGLQGEMELDSYLSRTCLVTHATREQQRAGIDRMVTRLADWSTVAVEYKTDRRARQTGKAYIETVSVEDHDQTIPGWAYKSRADILLYYVEPLTIYVLRMSDIRRMLARWRQTYRTVSSWNIGYRGQGVLVPLAELGQIAQKIIKLN